ncbi:hypothetical protein DMENIID0001_136300 [Sergentomyia squamirostris]
MELNEEWPELNSEIWPPHLTHTPGSGESFVSLSPPYFLRGTKDLPCGNSPPLFPDALDAHCRTKGSSSIIWGVSSSHLVLKIQSQTPPANNTRIFSSRSDDTEGIKLWGSGAFFLPPQGMYYPTSLQIHRISPHSRSAAATTTTLPKISRHALSLSFGNYVCLGMLYLRKI